MMTVGQALVQGDEARAAFAKAGFTRLFNMDGGITSWAKEIDTSLPTY